MDLAVMKTPNKFVVDYSDALAMCGDYYGGKVAISDAFKTGDNPTNRAAAKKLFENGPWKCIMGDTEDPRRFHYAIGDVALTVKGYMDKLIGSSMPKGCASYSDLVTTNYDHFAAQPTASFEKQGGAGAWEAYEAGHAVACDFAKDHGMPKVNEAIVMNGCASHFLSDMFAPGHQSNPRRAIAAHANRNGGLNSISATTKQFYSKWMHDEANQVGLQFTNEANMNWRGYGDGCYGMPENKKNNDIQVMTLKASVQLIVDTARDPTQHAKCLANAPVKRLVPMTSKIWNLESLKANRDIMPMFSSLMGPNTDIEKGPWIKMRGHRECQWFGTDWKPFCNTQSKPAGDWVDRDDTQRGGCTNSVTRNTFPSTQNTKSVCETNNMWLMNTQHPKCSPDKASSKVVCKSRHKLTPIETN